MKKILLLAGIFIGCMSLQAQQFEGTYREKTDSIAFSNDKVTFCISGFGGLSTAHVGEGSYELAGDYLFIHTSDYNGNKTSFQLLDESRKDTCVVKAVDLHNYPIQGVLVECRNKSGKYISGKVTDNDGKIFFFPCHKIASLSVNSLGYDATSFDYTPGKDYLIRLAENNVIQNQTVVFRILPIDEETISLLMLSDNFKSDKNKNGELQKLEKKAQKTNKLDKRLKKVYVSYLKRN